MLGLQMQGCAKRSVALLDQAAAGQHTFDALFLTSHSPLTTYDYLFHVDIPQQLPAQLQASDIAQWQHAEKKLEALVKQVGRLTHQRILSCCGRDSWCATLVVYCR